jgi:hypothetical protein
MQIVDEVSLTRMIFFMRKIIIHLTLFGFILSMSHVSAAEKPFLPNPPSAKEEISNNGEKSGNEEVEKKIDYNNIIETFKKLDTPGIYTLKEYSEKSLKSLKRVYLSKSKVTDDDLDKLSHLPNVLLWHLGASGRLTSGCLPAIARMKSARVMDLVNVKIFKDVESLIKTFQDHKNLEVLSAGGLEAIQMTERYQDFLKAHPGIIVITGQYQKTEVHEQHKNAVDAAIRKWIEDGLVTKEEAPIFAPSLRGKR